MSKINLPSGAVLEINLAPFSAANALNKAVAKELKSLKIDMEQDLMNPNFIKEIACIAISSDEIMAALDECFKRCTYNNIKVTLDVFEEEKARQDYYFVCKEVLQANILPFLKGLLSQLNHGKVETKGL